jgi:hypothetical protein
MRSLGLGLTWALSTGLFTWVGARADAWLGTVPVATLVGMVVGGVGGFVYFYHHAVVAPRERKRREDEVE